MSGMTDTTPYVALNSGYSLWYSLYMIGLTVYLRGIDDDSHTTASGASIHSTKTAVSGPLLPQRTILCLIVNATDTAYPGDVIIDGTDIPVSIACEQARANYVGSSLSCITVGTA